MHRQIGGEARRVCTLVYVRCVRVCVCVQHRGGREGMAGQQRQREKDGRSRQACHRFQRDAPSTRPTDWWRPCSKASWRERESSLRPLSPAWPALPTDGTLRWIGWTEERNTEREQERKWLTQIRGLYLWNHLCFVCRMRGCYQVMVTMAITVTSFVSQHFLCNQMKKRGIFIYENIKWIFRVIYNLNGYGHHLWLQ